MYKNPIILQFQDISKSRVLSTIDSYIAQGYVIGSFPEDKIDLVAYEGRKDKDIIIIEERKTFAKLNKREQKPIGFIRLKEKGKQLPRVLEVEIFINNKLPYDFSGNTFLTQLAIKLGEKYKVIDPSVLPHSTTWAELESIAKDVKNKPESKIEADDKDQNIQMFLQIMEQNMSEQDEKTTNVIIKQEKEPTVKTKDFSSTQVLSQTKKVDSKITDTQGGSNIHSLLPKGKKYRNRWKKAYARILETRENYEIDFNDQVVDHPTPTIDDLREVLIEIFGKKPSDRTVEKIIAAGDAGLLK